jgi:hypothetical protein
MAELLADSGGATAAIERLGARFEGIRRRDDQRHRLLLHHPGRVAQVRHSLRERLRSLPGRRNRWGTDKSRPLG